MKILPGIMLHIQRAAQTVRKYPRIVIPSVVAFFIYFVMLLPSWTHFVELMNNLQSNQVSNLSFLELFSGSGFALAGSSPTQVFEMDYGYRGVFMPIITSVLVWPLRVAPGLMMQLYSGAGLYIFLLVMLLASILVVSACMLSVLLLIQTALKKEEFSLANVKEKFFERITGLFFLNVLMALVINAPLLLSAFGRITGQLSFGSISLSPWTIVYMQAATLVLLPLPILYVMKELSAKKALPLLLDLYKKYWLQFVMFFSLSGIVIFALVLLNQVVLRELTPWTYQGLAYMAVTGTVRVVLSLLFITTLSSFIFGEDTKPIKISKSKKKN
jgi:hypothetical protein